MGGTFPRTSAESGLLTKSTLMSNQSFSTQEPTATKAEARAIVRTTGSRKTRLALWVACWGVKCTRWWMVSGSTAGAHPYVSAIRQAVTAHTHAPMSTRSIAGRMFCGRKIST